MLPTILALALVAQCPGGVCPVPLAAQPAAAVQYVPLAAQPADNSAAAQQAAALAAENAMLRARIDAMEATQFGTSPYASPYAPAYRAPYYPGVYSRGMLYARPFPVLRSILVPPGAAKAAAFR